MDANRIGVEFTREELGSHTVRIMATLHVDGETCSSQVVVSGPARDVDDFWSGAATMQDLSARWGVKP